MAKFYVQCGPVRTILTADSIEQAAFSAMDKALSVHLWIYDDEGLSEADCRDHLMLEALLHLEPSIQVSEQGFDRDDAALLGAPEFIDKWHKLMVGMSRLFVAAGLPPRPMSAVAGLSATQSTTPRLPR